MAPTASISIFDTELGNSYALLNRGMEAVRPTKGADEIGCPKKPRPACNGQDRGICLNLKGCPHGTGVLQQRREVNP